MSLVDSHGCQTTRQQQRSLPDHAAAREHSTPRPVPMASSSVRYLKPLLSKRRGSGSLRQPLQDRLRLRKSVKSVQRAAGILKASSKRQSRKEAYQPTERISRCCRAISRTLAASQRLHLTQSSSRKTGLTQSSSLKMDLIQSSSRKTGLRGSRRGCEALGTAAAQCQVVRPTAPDPNAHTFSVYAKYYYPRPWSLMVYFKY